MTGKSVRRCDVAASLRLRGRRPAARASSNRGSHCLVAGQRHHLLPFTSLGAVVLPPGGDAVVVEGDQAAVGEGDAVGVAAEIGEHGLRPGEGSLGVDDPLDLAQRRQMGREGDRLSAASRSSRHAAPNYRESGLVH
jgi:hypothetical protein